MEVAIVAGLPAKGNMDIDARQINIFYVFTKTRGNMAAQ